MSTSPTRIEADYTRGADARPAAALSWKRALAALAAAVVAVAVLIPVDGAVIGFARRFGEKGDLALGGDLRRELLFVQQWGDLVCTVIVFLAVFLLDRARRVRLWDAAGAVGVTAAAYQVLKLAIGRPRPKFDDPTRFFTSVEPYTLEAGSRYSWEFWRGISSDLWSMPSSHTAAAMCLTVVLMTLYPRLRPLVVPLAFIVGLCRVLFAAHYPSDVVAGLAVGYIAAGLAMEGRWGSRLVRRLGGRSETSRTGA